jgi:hypothetical protein
VVAVGWGVVVVEEEEEEQEEEEEEGFSPTITSQFGPALI